MMMTRSRMSPVRRKFLFTLSILVVMSCQVIPTPPTLQAPLNQATSEGSPALEGNIPTQTSGPQAASTAPIRRLEPFPVPNLDGFSNAEPAPWRASDYAGEIISFPVSPDMLSNRQVIAGLTLDQQNLLFQNGFVIIPSREAQFSAIREQVALYDGQPFYLSSDSAYHALHLQWGELTNLLELEELHPRIKAITQAVYLEVSSYIPLVRDTELQGDVQIAAAYMGVALKLLDPGFELDPELRPLIMAEVSQIRNLPGIGRSVLFPGIEHDYSVYKPIGHYAQNPILSAFYQGMTWYERTAFELSASYRGFTPSRIPLILTYALRRAVTAEGISAAQEWKILHETLSYLYGPSQNYGPYEYTVVMNQVYGEDVSLLRLAAEPLWETFLAYVQDIPPPQGSREAIFLPGKAYRQHSWRFIGEYTRLDESITQDLVYEWVSTEENRRDLPSGLDVMASLGSPAAMAALEQAGVNAYANYTEQLTTIQESLHSQNPKLWFYTAPSTLLFANAAQLDPNISMYPPHMNASLWRYKELNSALGAWAESRASRIIKSQFDPDLTPENKPTSAAAPCAVELNPLVFYRLAAMASNLVDGLTQRGLSGGDLESLFNPMLDLSDRLQRLGDIAAKELAGEPLQESDCALVHSPLGAYEEHDWQMRLNEGLAETQMPQVPVISTIQSAQGRMLQTGIGAVDRIYVLIQRDGELQVAQGGVYSYYEFTQPSDERLSEYVWQRVVMDEPPQQPAWAEYLILPGGNPVRVLAFRIGDTYRITPAGENLSMRETPSRSGKAVWKLSPGDYVLIIDGPVRTEGYTWWQLQLLGGDGEPIEGWSAVNPDWYERAWGQ